MRPRGMMSSPLRGGQYPGSPLKRIAPMPRMPGMAGGQNNLNTAGAVNPATLDAVARLCRICGNPNAVIFRLKDKIELLERVDKVLGLKIDLDVDEKRTYPGVVCRKCCNLVETFFHYKKSVSEGQLALKTQVEEHKRVKEARKEAEAVAVRGEPLTSPTSPGSIGVD